MMKKERNYYETNILVFFSLSLGLVGSLPAIQKMQITEPSQLPEDRMLPDISWPQNLIQKMEGLVRNLSDI